MSGNIRRYKDLKKIIKKLRTQTSSYGKYFCAPPFISLLKDKEVKGNVSGLFEWKDRLMTHFVKQQFLTSALLFRSVKFFYRICKKNPKRLLWVGVVLIFSFSGVQLKKWWSK
ncbi:MAG: hypothetical protein ACMUEL_00045 [Flavobacteriales bacterium Tduv]